MCARVHIGMKLLHAVSLTPANSKTKFYMTSVRIKKNIYKWFYTYMHNYIAYIHIYMLLSTSTHK